MNRVYKKMRVFFQFHLITSSSGKMYSIFKKNIAALRNSIATNILSKNIPWLVFLTKTLLQVILSLTRKGQKLFFPTMMGSIINYYNKIFSNITSKNEISCCWYVYICFYLLYISVIISTSSSANDCIPVGVIPEAISVWLIFIFLLNSKIRSYM